MYTWFTYTNNYSPLLGGSNYGLVIAFSQGSNIYRPLFQKTTFILFLNALDQYIPTSKPALLPDLFTASGAN